MKILLISGHGAGDPGASGCGYRESDLTVEMVNGIKPLLEKYATVDLYPVERNAYKDIKNGALQVNFANYNYVLEIHFNAYNGAAKGTEIYVTSKETAVTVENAVMGELSKLFKVRGVKVEDFLVIRTAKNKGVSSALLETCFVDNAEDMQVYQSNKQAVFSAIANAVIRGFGLVGEKPPVVETPKQEPTTGANGEYTGNSIVDYLNSKGIDSSFANRTKLAREYDINGYVGTGAQNLALLDAMRGNIKPQPTVAYYPAFNSRSIVDGLKSIGVDSSTQNRNKIAIANGISNYSGTASQNSYLCELARQGKLKKA